jgi:hypothetical protein
MFLVYGRPRIKDHYPRGGRNVSHIRRQLDSCLGRVAKIDQGRFRA